MRRLGFLLIVLLLTAGKTWAQAVPAADQTEMTKSLLQRIESLEKRLAELEGRVDPPASISEESLPGPAAERAQPAAALAGHNHPELSLAQVDQSLPAQAETHYPSLKLSGFTDINFSATDRAGSSSGFNLGQFILHVVSPLSQKISYVGEISFTAQPTGFNLEVERSIIRYDYNDYFKVSFGRYHTPVNYWNTAFHHGLWLQTTISRPEMIQFGGRFLPVHFVGLQAEGNIPSRGLGLGYNLGLGNGRASIISRGGDAGDVNNNRAWLVKLFARPGRLHHLQFGGSVYHDKISPAIGPSFLEWITSAHLVWDGETPEILAEFANVHHREVQTSNTFNSQAFYLQLGYRLPWEEKRWKPYYRFEYINTPISDPILGVPDLVGSTIGIRYDISDYAAFKGEYRNTLRERDPRFKDRVRVNGLFLQTSFTF